MPLTPSMKVQALTNPTSHSATAATARAKAGSLTGGMSIAATAAAPAA